MNKIKGKFTLMIDKLITFGEDFLEKYYNLTKGKINNLFEIKAEKQTLYLIKSKILSELLDNGKFNFDYTKLINSIKSSPLPNFNYISIAYCPNNIYTPFAYVSMISILFKLKIRINIYLILYNYLNTFFENKHGFYK